MYSDSLLRFIDASPVSFLAVAEVRRRLAEAGFRFFSLAEPFPTLCAGESLMTTKNSSALFALRPGRRPVEEAGFKLICAHTDSPTFRIKPQAEMRSEGGLWRLNTEVYGGPILSTWFDRPLSLAGRVMLRGASAFQPEERLLHIRRPLFIIPNLAIHFNRQVNDGVKLNRQKDLLPLTLIAAADEELSLSALVAKELGVEATDVLDFDLYLYDTTPACRIGMNGELISASRLDDLSMVHAALEAFLAAEESDATQVLAFFDNEETGSGTKQGAHSPVLRDLLLRYCGGEVERLCRAIERSFMVSADNAHAFHPNYAEKYDPTNHPQLGGGPVIKINAAQKYATDARGAAVFRSVCEAAGVPCQTFVNHSEVAGGSTLGNILTAQLPLAGVDMGNPILGMHSLRETASAADHEYCIRAFTSFFNQK